MNTKGLMQFLMVVALGAAFSSVSSAQPKRDGGWYRTCSDIKLNANKTGVEARCQKSDGTPVPASFVWKGLQYRQPDGLVFTIGHNTYQSKCSITGLALPAGQLARLEATCEGKQFSIPINLVNNNGALAQIQ